MKALSLWQPWASLIACGVKTIETRSWSTPYRGPLAIHAAKTEKPERSFAAQLLADKGGLSVDLPHGAVIATCTLVDVVLITGSNDAGYLNFICPSIYGDLTLYRFGYGAWQPPTLEEGITAQLPYGDFTEGRFGWLLADIKPIEPVAAVGHQQLWEWVGTIPEVVAE